MLLQFAPCPGALFIITSAALGLSDQDMRDMRAKTKTDNKIDFVWGTVSQAAELLAQLEPQGNC